MLILWEYFKTKMKKIGVKIDKFKKNDPVVMEKVRGD